jgi:hypothetical protein
VTRPWLRHSCKDSGKQFGRSGRAGYLSRHRRSGRRPDDQIGLGHIQPGVTQTGDDTDSPGLPDAPPPPRTSARSLMTGTLRNRNVVDTPMRRGRVRPMPADVVQANAHIGAVTGFVAVQLYCREGGPEAI